MAISFVAKSAFASGTAGLSVGAVAGTAADDLILLFVESANQPVATPSGYTAVTGGSVAAGTANAAGGMALQVFYRWATGADTTTTVADSGDHTTAIKLAYRGVDKLTPFDAATVTGTKATASTASSYPGITTTTPSALVVYSSGLDLDAASTATTSAQANAALTSITERHDQTVASGFGGGIVVTDGVKATAGASGNLTATVTSTTQVYITVALRDAATAKTLTPPLYDNSPTEVFYAPTVTQNSPAQTLTQASRFNNTSTFNTHSIANVIDMRVSWIEFDVANAGAALEATLTCSSSTSAAATTAIKLTAAVWGFSSSTSSVGVTTRTWAQPVYGNGVWVSVASGSAVAIRSVDDGGSWQEQTLPSSSTWDTIVFGNGTFVAWSSTSAVGATSSDGVTWAPFTPPVALGSKAAYGAGLFVAIGYDNTTGYYTSPNGSTWTARTTKPTAYANFVSFANGLFLYGSNGAPLFTSPDGLTWTQRPTAINDARGVAYGNGVFTLVGLSSEATTPASYSSDGLTWTTTSIPGVLWGRQVCFDTGSKVFFAGGTTGGSACSNDGVKWYWSSASSFGNGNTVYGPGYGMYATSTAFNKLQLISNSTSATATLTSAAAALAASAACVSTRTAALTTSIQLAGALGTLKLATPNATQTLVVNTNTKRVAVNSAGRIVAVYLGTSVVSTDNGVTYTQYTGQAFGTPSGLVCIADTFYLLSTSVTIYTSTDGVTWAASYTAPGIVTDLAFDGTTYVLMRQTGTTCYYGTSLASLSTAALSMTPTGLRYSGGRFMFTAGSSSVVDYSTTGTSFSSSAALPSNTVGKAAYLNGEYYVTAITGVYKTSDFASWTPVFTGRGYAGSGRLFEVGAHLVLSAQNPNISFFTSSGDSWHVMSTSGFVSPLIEDLAAVPSSGGAARFVSTNSSASASALDHFPVRDIVSPTTAAGLTTAIYLSASVSTTSTLTGVMLSPAAFISNAQVQASVAAAVTTAIRLNSVLSDQVTVTGAALATQVKLNTSIAAASTVTAALSTQIPLSGAVSALTTVTSPAITTAIKLAATPASLATQTGSMTTAIRLAATPAAQTTIVAPLTTQIPLVPTGTLTSASTVTASLTANIRMAAAPVAAASTNTPVLTTAIQLVASSAALNTVNASLQNPAALVSSIGAVSTVTAGLTTAIKMSGSLLVGQRQNLFTNSEQFESVWSGLAFTVTPNAATAPNGEVTADLFTRTATSASYLGRSATKAASVGWYTLSVYAQKSVGDYVSLRLQGTYPGRADTTFNLNTGVVSGAATAFSGFANASSSITNVGGGWYRVTLTAQSDTATVVTGYFSFNTNGVNAIDGTDSAANSAGYLWGAQLETGPAASGYTPTYGTAVNDGKLTAALTTAFNLTGSVAVASVSSATTLQTAIQLASSALTQTNIVFSTLNTGIPLNASVANLATVPVAAITTQIKLAAASASSSSVTAALTTGIPLSASVASLASVPAAALTAQIALAAAPASSSTQTGALTTAIYLAAAAAAQSSASSSLQTPTQFAGSVAAQSSVTGVLTTMVNLGASAAAQTNITAPLTTGISLAGSAAAQTSIPSVPLLTGYTFAASVSTASTVSAALTTAIQLDAYATVQSTASSSMIAATYLTAAAADTVTLAGNLSAQIKLVSAQNLATSVSAGLTTAIKLESSGTATAVTLTGSLTVAQGLSAAPAAQASATASLTTGIRLNANPAAESNRVTAILYTGILFDSVTATVSSTATGNLTTGIRLAASRGAVASMDSYLTSAIPLNVALTSSASLSGDLTIAKPLVADLLVSSSAAGALTVAAGLSAALQVSSSTAANLSIGVTFTGGLLATRSTVTASLTTAVRMVGSVYGSTTLYGDLQVVNVVYGEGYRVSREPRNWVVERELRNWTVSRKARNWTA